MVKRLFYAIAICAFLSLLAGCATTVGLSTQDKKTLQTVSIDPKVTMPVGMIYFSDPSGKGALLGPFGGALVARDAQKVTKQLVALTEKNKISISDMVLDQVITQLSKKTNLQLVKREPNAVLTIQILQYGLISPLEFSSNLSPILQVQMQLHQGARIIWQDSARTFPLTSGLPRTQLAIIEKNPLLLAEMWNAAAKMVTGEILAGLSLQLRSGGSAASVPRG